MPADLLCHYSRQPCMREKCVKWGRLQGRNPQTGEHIDRWDCNDNHHVVLELERNAALRELNAEVATMRSEHYVQMETVLLMTGRQDILQKYIARRDHIRSLNRTEELVRERAARLDHKEAIQ